MPKKSPSKLEKELLKKINILRKAIERGDINHKEADYCIEKLLFEDRKINILEWGKYYFPSKFDLPFCSELHNYLVSICQEPFAATYAPRGYAKTTLKSFLCKIYLALNFPDLFKHYLSVQATTSKAISVNLSIRQEIEENELLKRDYGDLKGAGKWTEKRFVLVTGVIFSCIGAGESMRGINHNNIRPDYIDIDDIYDEEDINNSNRIKKKNNWFWSSLYKCVAKGKKICIHIQGTAVSRVDLISLLSKRDRWKYKKFQAVKDWNKKKVLWPEVEDFKKLTEDREAMGTIIFERELQNNCRDDATAIIKESWIRYYDGALPDNKDEGGERIEYKIGGCDPSVGENEGNDSTAFIAMYRSNFGNYYLHDAINERLTFSARKIAAKNFHDKHVFDRLKIEAISAFQDFANELRRTTRVPVKIITCVKDKISRLEGQSAKFENSKVFINKNLSKKICENGSNLLDEIVYQLINNKPEHDDIRDAIVLSLEDTKSGLMLDFI